MNKVVSILLVFVLLATACGSEPSSVNSGAAQNSADAVSETSATDASDDAPSDVTPADDNIVEDVPWIDARDAMIERAGGRWSDSDFDVRQFGSVASQSAPIEVDQLTEFELTDCKAYFEELFELDDDSRTAYLDHLELEHYGAVVAYGDADRMMAMSATLVERCPKFVFDELSITVTGMEFETVTSSFRVTVAEPGRDGERGEVNDAWLSLAGRDSVVTLLVLVGSGEFTEEDVADFTRLTALQAEVLAEAFSG